MNIVGCLIYFQPAHEAEFVGYKPATPMMIAPYFYIRKFSLTRSRSGRLIWKGEIHHSLNFFLTEADAIEEVKSEGWILLKRKIGKENGWDRKSYWYKEGDI